MVSASTNDEFSTAAVVSVDGPQFALHTGIRCSVLFYFHLFVAFYVNVNRFGNRYVIYWGGRPGQQAQVLLTRERGLLRRWINVRVL